MRFTNIVILLSVTLFFACETTSPTTPVADYSDKAELTSIQLLATKTLGLKIDHDERQGSERNFLAVKSDRILVSQRLDSRTFFVQDNFYGLNNKAGVFKGDDKELQSFCYEIVKRFNINPDEINKAEVLHEKIQEGSFDDKTGKFTAGEPTLGRRMARCTRYVEGIPVFSSKIIVGLTQDKTIGFMELHWPVIPETTIKEAHRLQYKVKNGWKAPEQKGATIESVEAGIIHSAAAGFLMDIYPAIRVIYAPEEEGIGRKLMLHFDRHGNEVPIPREFDIACEKPKKRGATK
jgi:hypothetical protein